MKSRLGKVVFARAGNDSSRENEASLTSEKVEWLQRGHLCWEGGLKVLQRRHNSLVLSSLYSRRARPLFLGRKIAQGHVARERHLRPACVPCGGGTPLASLFARACRSSLWFSNFRCGWQGRRSVVCGLFYSSR